MVLTADDCVNVQLAEPPLPVVPAVPLTPAEPVVPALPLVPAGPFVPALPVVPALPFVPALPVVPAAALLPPVPGVGPSVFPAHPAIETYATSTRQAESATEDETRRMGASP